jgi:energy-coupling factor transport system ATP-binding protein
MEKLNREEGKTIITITHYMDEAVRADRVIVIDDGRIILDGKPSEIFARADRIRECGLDLPQCSDLVLKLRARGIDVSGEINTPEQCAEAIANSLKKR